MYVKLNSALQKDGKKCRCFDHKYNITQYAVKMHNIINIIQHCIPNLIKISTHWDKTW